MIDLHTHILPGVDDGARTLEESVAIGRAAQADGITIVAATPHVNSQYPTTPATMERLLGEVRAALAAAGVTLDVRSGGEIAVERLSQLTAEEIQRFALGGRNHLLLEFPYVGWPLELPTRIGELRRSGVTPILAHPERNGDVGAAPDRLRPLVEAGALVQLTASSLDGRAGAKARRAANALLDLGLAHLVASDAHSHDRRPGGLSAAVRALRDEELARWLVVDVPAAILAGRSPPPKPYRRRSRWRLRERGARGF